MYPAAGSAQSVVLARDDVFADALAGSPMAKVFDGPVLLTPTNSLSSSASDGIARVLRPGGTIYVLGGTAAISDTVVNRLKQLGFPVVRIGGADRYETAALIAQRLAGAETVANVYLATGANFPDALSAASAAGSDHGVILLTADTSVPAATASWLNAHPSLPRIAVGGQAAHAVPTARPLFGADRYATSVAVAAATYPAAPGLIIATGTAFPDALAGAALAAQRGDGMLLFDPQTATPSAVQASYLTSIASSASQLVVLGGQAAMPDAVVGVVATALGHPQ